MTLGNRASAVIMPAVKQKAIIKDIVAAEATVYP